MSKTKKANEGVVTAIGDADLVMVSGANGGMRPISFVNLMAAVRNGIQVGARNLIGNNVYNNTIDGALATKGVKINNTSRFVLTTAPIKDAGWYAYSFWAKAESSTNINVDINDCSQSKFTIGTEWTYCSGISKVIQWLDQYGFLDISTSVSMNNKVIVSDITVVKGNIPLTSWVPAPEDIASGLWGG